MLLDWLIEITFIATLITNLRTTCNAESLLNRCDALLKVLLSFPVFSGLIFYYNCIQDIFFSNLMFYCTELVVSH